MIEFILNDKKIKTDLPPGTTVLDFVRYHKRLTGTKIGCREGDCGACSILVGNLKSDKIHYQTMTSCLMPISNALGKHIVTVEGINMHHLSPVQQAMVDQNGTQCGFCTVGFVMSLTTFVMSEKLTYEDAVAAFDGNICRCTGYKSIERAAEEIVGQLEGKPSQQRMNWLVERKFIPKYFLEIKDRLKYFESISNGKTEIEEIIFLGGGTDLFVQKPEAMRGTPTQNLFDQSHLKGIQIKDGKCVVGASTSITEMEDSPAMQSLFPDLKKYTKLIASTPIRNMATPGGNFNNASPIGDLTIFFLALDAEIILNNNQTTRSVKLKDFYLDYKKLAKEKDEFIEKIVFLIPSEGSLFNFEKVSKRTHLDIASVNSACLIKMDDDKNIEKIHLSAGGVGPTPKYLKETCTFLLGKKLTPEIIEQAIEKIQAEISPISDARGTATYKRLLLRQLFVAHLLKFDPTILTPEKIAAL